MPEIKKINGKIKSWEIVNKGSSSLEEPEQVKEVIIKNDIYTRDEILPSLTIKTKFSSSESMYVTIGFDVNIIPREIFINKSSSESDEWCKAMSRQISAIFRRATSISDVRFVVDDLLQIKGHDVFSNGERLVFGPVQALGYVLKKIFDIAEDDPAIIKKYMYVFGSDDSAKIEMDLNQNTKPKEGKASSDAPALECPDCGNISYVNNGGCWACQDCGYSKCG